MLKGMTPEQHCQQEIKKSSGKGYFKKQSPGEDVCMLPGGYFSGGNLEGVFSYYYDTYEKIELSSETTATLPKNRTRTTIGVGEEVTIYSNTPVKWQVNTSLINSSVPQGLSNRFTFTALDKAGSVTITAKHDYDEESITFSIIEPKEVKFKLAKKVHIKDVMGTGFTADMFILPNTVNFSAIQFRELESYARGSGILSDATGQPHGDYKDGGSKWLECFYSNGKPNYLNGTDLAYGGRNDYPVPLPLPESGNVTFFIYYEWKLGKHGRPKKNKFRRYSNHPHSNERLYYNKKK
ncbi:hypothetical protein BWD07_10460 [Neisseria canis]|nr:hypothetical protein BWD07_10460 [Neisseria canis]